MDIRNWPVDQIMQLPDCCFGRRWPIAFAANLPPQQIERYISPEALPERTVIWNISSWGYHESVLLDYIRLALGDQAPASDAIFNALEPLLPVRGGDGIYLGGFQGSSGTFVSLPMRVPIASAGRRIAVRFINGSSTIYCSFNLWILVSSMPREVPDCLISEYLRSR